jgi:hypothetical protein
LVLLGSETEPSYPADDRRADALLDVHRRGVESGIETG